MDLEKINLRKFDSIENLFIHLELLTKNDKISLNFENYPFVAKITYDDYEIKIQIEILNKFVDFLTINNNKNFSRNVVLTDRRLYLPNLKSYSLNVNDNFKKISMNHGYHSFSTGKLNIKNFNIGPEINKKLWLEKLMIELSKRLGCSFIFISERKRKFYNIIKQKSLYEKLNYNYIFDLKELFESLKYIEICEILNQKNLSIPWKSKKIIFNDFVNHIHNFLVFMDSNQIYNAILLNFF